MALTAFQSGIQINTGIMVFLPAQDAAAAARQPIFGPMPRLTGH